MPSQKRQFNVRPDDATWELIDRVKPVVESSIGIGVSYTDLLRLGMLALEEKHGGPQAVSSGASVAESEPKKPAPKKGKAK